MYTHICLCIYAYMDMSHAAGRVDEIEGILVDSRAQHLADVDFSKVQCINTCLRIYVYIYIYIYIYTYIYICTYIHICIHI